MRASSFAATSSSRSASSNRRRSIAGRRRKSFPRGPEPLSRRCSAGPSCSTCATRRSRGSSCPDEALPFAEHPQLALRLDVTVVELEHLLEGRRRALLIADHLLHLPEEEVGGDASVEHLERLADLRRAIFESGLPILGEEEPRVPAPGVELRFLRIQDDGLVEHLQAFLVLARLDEDLRPLELVLRVEDASDVDLLLVALQLLLVLLAPGLVAEDLGRLVHPGEETLLDYAEIALGRVGDGIRVQIAGEQHEGALDVRGGGRLAVEPERLEVAPPLPNDEAGAPAAAV